MREKVTALVLLVVLGFYSATIGWRGVELIRDGRPVPVLLGVAVILIPVVALLAMVPLVRLARDGSRMMAQARELRCRRRRGRDELEQAEACRVARDRKGEQAHYRAAVRAWRTVGRATRRHGAPGIPWAHAPFAHRHRPHRPPRRPPRRGLAFWAGVQGCAPRPDGPYAGVGEVGTLNLEVQRLEEGPPRIHLDIETDDIRGRGGAG